MKKKLKKCRKFASSVVATTMVMSTINAPLAIYASDNSAQESAEKIEFKTAGEDSIYKGLPLFDGIPAHLDAYLDVLMDYIGTEGMVRYALGYRGDYQLRFGEHAGNIIPGSELFGDHVQGVSTDFPAIIALGQTWNQGTCKKSR